MSAGRLLTTLPARILDTETLHKPPRSLPVQYRAETLQDFSAIPGSQYSASTPVLDLPSCRFFSDSASAVHPESPPLTPSWRELPKYLSARAPDLSPVSYT